MIPRCNRISSACWGMKWPTCARLRARGWSAWRPEWRCIQRREITEAELAVGDVEALRDEVRIVTGAAHAHAEAAVVVLAAAHVADAVHDVRGLARFVRR